MQQNKYFLFNFQLSSFFISLYMHVKMGNKSMVKINELFSHNVS